MYLSLGNAAWAHGNSLVNYMKMVEFIGLSGPIKFDASGLRTQFAMDLMELQMPGLVKQCIQVYIFYNNVPFLRPKLVHGIVLINLTLQELKKKRLETVLIIQWQTRPSSLQLCW